MAQNTRVCEHAALARRSLQEKLSETDESKLAQHLDACPTCQAIVDSGGNLAGFQDDLRWAERTRDQVPLDVNVPLARLNERLADYEVVEEIGRGGMGIVYKARQLELDRVVALKVLPALLGAVQPEAMTRFKREATLAASLDHTNIIGVHEFGEIDGTLYYAMQLVEGRSLRDILREIDETGSIGGVVGEQSGETCTRLGQSSSSDRAYFRRVAEWVAEVADALHYAHEKGVIHRDIKPSNLLVNRDGKLLISDFGLARQPDQPSMTETRSLIGTARYMAPEQVDERAAQVDRRVDVYGLGATLYELLSFRPMFGGANDREILDHVLNKEPSPPSRHVRQVPRDLETICFKAIRKERGERYASAKDLADDLRRWLLNLPVFAQRPSPVIRFGKFVRRRKIEVAAASVCVLLLAVSAALFGAYRMWRADAITTHEVALTQQARLLALDAERALYDGRTDAALTNVDRAIELSTAAPELIILRANILHKMKRYQDCIVYLESAGLTGAAAWPSHYLLARAYTGLDDRHSAEEHLRQVEQLNPDTCEALYLRALVLDDATEALGFAQLAVERDPANIEAVCHLMRRHFELRDYEGVLYAAERAVSLRPNWWATQYMHGEALGLLGHHDRAERAFTRSIEFDPTQAVNWAWRAAVRYNLRRYSEAIADTTEAIRIDPTVSQAFLVRGSSKLQLGNSHGAKSDLDRAIELNPNYPEALLTRGEFLLNSGQLSEAIDDLTRYLAVRPGDLRALNQRAVAFLQSTQYQSAVVDFDLVLTLPVDSYNTSTGGSKAPRAYYARGVAHLHLRNYEQAIADQTAAIHMEEDNLSAYAYRGIAHEMTGQFVEAAADYKFLADRIEGDAKIHPLLWEYFLQVRQGNVNRTEEILNRITGAKWETPWVSALVEFLSGDSTVDALVDAATDDDERRSSYYFAGMQTAANRIQKDAKDAFIQCVNAYGPGHSHESEFARIRLREMSEHGRRLKTIRADQSKPK